MIIEGNVTNQFIENLSYILIDFFKYDLLSKYRQQLIALNKEFNINFAKVIIYALSNLDVSKSKDTCVLSISAIKKYNNKRIADWINALTLGNLSVRGVPIIDEIFAYGAIMAPLVKEGLNVN